MKMFFTDEPYQKITVHSDSLPWFWIGIQRHDGTIITYTEVINNYIEYGICVTPHVLSAVTSEYDGIWKYVDCKTLEEKDFPSEGFIIEECPK